MRKFLVAAWEVCEVVFVAVATVFIIRTFLIQPFQVSGASMEPNFSDGNYLLIDEITPRFQGFARGQVIVFKPPVGEQTFFIKRIIGLPGEQIDSRDGNIRITKGTNSFLLDESYLAPSLRSDDDFSVTLSDNQYFVMGDNRSHSYDSRNWGALNPESIVGTVRLRLWPVNDFDIFTAPSYEPASR